VRLTSGPLHKDVVGGGAWVTEWPELVAAIPIGVGEVVAAEEVDVVVDQG